jgi:uncharacterized membrane protein YphA (DoxX/SURF4 family)
LKRRYTKFPAGLPAIGLLLLRSAIGVRLLVEGLACVEASQSHLEGLALGVLALVTGTSLVLGFLTPLVAGVSALAGAVCLLHPAWVSFLGCLNVTTTAVAVAILLLGPGAISLDAYFFGRRKIIIPGAVRS